MDLTRELTEDVAPRFRYVYVLVAGFFLLLVGRLVKLQLLDGDRYRLFALAHSIKELRVPAPRGEIVDRHGVSLVQNRRSYAVVAIPQELPAETNGAERVMASVAELLQLPPEAVVARLAGRGRFPAYEPLLLGSHVSYDALARIRAWQTPWPEAGDRYDLRGISITDRMVRAYADGTAFTHLIGYLREINAAELADWEARAPGMVTAGDLIGATGLEAAWDGELRGRDGLVERLVDARGREVAFPELALSLRSLPPQPGPTVRLTIDARLQQAAAQAFAGKAGAVVAIEPATGNLLALYSAPSYDLGALQTEARQPYWQSLITDSAKPLLNRAIQSAYPPGSTYKIVTAAAGLGEGAITPNETIHCAGGLTVGGRRFGCWRTRGHGAVNLRRAIAESCDVYFYTVGLRVGPDRLADYAHRFGLGERTGIALPHERTGLIPTTAWKVKARGTPWQQGETLSIAIGQGYDTATPLQAAVMIATVANGGRLVHPHLVAEGTQQSRETQEIPPNVIGPIQDGLAEVVASPAGTAHRLAALDLDIAGKTGTAQVISLLKGRGHGRFADHAWFVAYAPARDPQIAVAVFVEHGGHGGATAAPIAGELIKEYLSDGQKEYLTK